MKISTFTVSKLKEKSIKAVQKRHNENCKKLEQSNGWRKSSKIKGFCFGTDHEYEEEGIVLFFSEYCVNKGEKVIAITASPKISGYNFERFIIGFSEEYASDQIIVFQKKVYEVLKKIEIEDGLNLKFMRFKEN